MKIKSKKLIHSEEPIAVYDISVPETHNFALGNGVIVHNSKDVMDGIVGSYWACKTAKTQGGILTIEKNQADTDFKRRLRQIKQKIAPNHQQLDPDILMNFIKS